MGRVLSAAALVVLVLLLTVTGGGCHAASSDEDAVLATSLSGVSGRTAPSSEEAPRLTSLGLCGGHTAPSSEKALLETSLSGVGGRAAPSSKEALRPASLSGGSGGHASLSDEEAVLATSLSGVSGRAAPSSEEALLATSLSGVGSRAAPSSEEALRSTSLSGGSGHAFLPAEETRLPRLSGGVGGNSHATSEEATPAAAAAVAGSMPRWAKARLRRLLRNKVDAVVSKNRRHPGDYATIAEALAAAPPLPPPGAPAPSARRRRYVVHVRAGTYEEVLRINRRDITIMGDGMGETIITGNRSKHTGHDTINSAIVSALSDGFMARDLTIRNTAGVIAEQAVAFLSTSDRSVCFRCDLDGFQDTLNADKNLQFYHSCNISGTVDFVFGYAKAVFQECNLIVRRPKMPGGHCVISAQGRNQANDSSGFIFHDCTVTEMAGAGLLNGKVRVPVFLGRPWKTHSHVVFMRTFLDTIVDPSGWEKWNASVEVPSTVFYGEFQNRGPGADTRGRVNWPAFHMINASVAAGYTVRNFIQGDEWLPDFGIKYKPGLE